MPGNLENKVLLVGAGPMAVEYSRVLEHLKIDYTVIGRGMDSSARFESESGKFAISGGLEKFLRTNHGEYTRAIVAVPVDQLAVATRMLIDTGIKNILLEKPGGLTIDEVKTLTEFVITNNASVFIAYNRRFYSSALKAKEIIADDGGVTSYNFEFTEWSHLITDLKKSDEIKSNWFFANSTHVIDLAFYLGGSPKDLSSFTSGGLTWHPTASIFAGAGITETGVLFSYNANWEAPGRWGVEILTRKHRLILRPMEKLHIQEIGSVGIKEVSLNDELDLAFKPGLFRQTEAFLTAEMGNLLKLSDHKKNCEHYLDILSPRSNNE